jgi:hypothetical protein
MHSSKMCRESPAAKTYSVYPDTTNASDSALNSMPPIASTNGSCTVHRLHDKNEGMAAAKREWLE